MGAARYGARSCKGTALIKSGFADEQRIVNMGIADLLKIPKITPAEIQAIDQFQTAIKAGNTLSFFIEEEHHDT